MIGLNSRRFSDIWTKFSSAPPGGGRRREEERKQTIIDSKILLE
jgi:hypothetical protein